MKQLIYTILILTLLFIGCSDNPVNNNSISNDSLLFQIDSLSVYYDTNNVGYIDTVYFINITDSIKLKTIFTGETNNNSYNYLGVRFEHPTILFELYGNDINGSHVFTTNTFVNHPYIAYALMIPTVGNNNYIKIKDIKIYKTQ